MTDMDRPWLGSYPPELDWHARFEAKPLYALIDEAASKWPDHVHMTFMGRRITYAESAQMVDRAAEGFRRLGVKKGVHVGLFLPNCPQFIVCYYAVLKAGGTVVNFSPLYSEPELLNQVEDSCTDMMVTLDLVDLYPKMLHVLRESRLRGLVVSELADALPRWKGLAFNLFRRKRRAAVEWGADHTRYADLLANAPIAAPAGVDPQEDVAVLQYTGGTTGVPKGAMLTHANLSINAAQTLYWDPSVRPGHDVMMGALPLFHVFAMTLVMNAGTLGGAKIVLMPKFELEKALKLVGKERVTLMPGVPTMFSAILNFDRRDSYDLSSLRTCLSGGAPLPAEVKRAFEKAVPGVGVNEGYGLTESSPTVSATPIRGGGKSGSIGLPLPDTEIVIMNKDTGEGPLPTGETGEICIRGPQVMKGYWNRPEETEAVFNGDLLRTGDIGYMDEDGYTFLIDRSKDLILVGGFNVFPRTVEEVIYTHPSVAEATVIGVPDPYLGEAPKAFVVVKQNHELSESSLRAFLKERLGKHEMPRRIEFREALPKTMIGKLSKKELVEEERAKYEAGSSGNDV